MAAVADWPDHEYEWNQVNAKQVKESLKLPFTAVSKGAGLLSDGDRGLFISGTIDPFKPNDVEPSGAKVPVKIKLKIGGAKRAREDEEVTVEGEIREKVEGKKTKT